MFCLIQILSFLYVIFAFFSWLCACDGTCPCCICMFVRMCCICIQACVDSAVMGFSAVLKRVFKWSHSEAGRTGQTADVNTERWDKVSLEVGEGGWKQHRTRPTGEADDANDKTELWTLKSHQHQEEAEYQLTGSLGDQLHIWQPGFLNTNGVSLSDTLTGCYLVDLFQPNSFRN